MQFALIVRRNLNCFSSYHNYSFDKLTNLHDMRNVTEAQFPREASTHEAHDSWHEFRVIRTQTYFTGAIMASSLFFIPWSVEAFHNILHLRDLPINILIGFGGLETPLGGHNESSMHSAVALGQRR